MEKKKNYDGLIKALQIASVVFMAAMLITALVLMKKYDISVKNAAALKQWLSGSAFTVALIIIVFTIVKSFALVITPSIVFAVSGIVFDNLGVAILVNFIATVTSMLIPYYLGRFTGKGMYDSLKRKFPKVQKFDDFTDENEFLITFLVKATGVIPGDVSSLLLGAIGISFKNFFIAANLGTLPLNILWALAGNKGNFSDPKTFLYVLPVIFFALGASLVMKRFTSRHAAKSAPAEETAAEETAE